MRKESYQRKDIKMKRKWISFMHLIHRKKEEKRVDQSKSGHDCDEVNACETADDEKKRPAESAEVQKETLGEHHDAVERVVTQTSDPKADASVKTTAADSKGLDSEAQIVKPDVQNPESAADTPTTQAEEREWIQGKLFSTMVLDGRQVLGKPTGTFYEIPRTSKQLNGACYRPDLAADIASIKNWKVMASSMRGASHYGSSTERQDSYAIGEAKGKYIIAAIADGVSSAKMSSGLADFVCQQTVRAVREELEENENIAEANADVWKKLAKEIVAKAQAYCRKRIAALTENKTDSLDLASNYWATTLAYAVVMLPEKEGLPASYAYVSVSGDSSCYIVNQDKGWYPVLKGKTGSNEEVITNSVPNPLPYDPGEAYVQEGILKKGDQLMLTTDGIADFIREGSTPLAGLLQMQLTQTKNLISFLEVLDTPVFMASDDRTVILIKEG